MKRLLLMIAIVLTSASCLPASAQAAFGINNFDLTFTDQDGTTATQAGSHPFAMTISLGTNFDQELIPEGWLRDLSIEPISGLVADTTAYPRCTTAEFLEVAPQGGPACPLSTQVGITAVSTGIAGFWQTYPIFNLPPPPGALVRIGFRVVTVNIFVDIGLSPDPPYNPIGALRNSPQLLNVFGSKTQLWGDPSDPAHDELRGSCGSQGATLAPGDIEGFEFKETGKSCPVAPRPKPLLTVPTNCAEALINRYQAVSWNDRDEDGKADTDAGARETHDAQGNPQPLTGCGKVGYKPTIKAKPTSESAESGTGIDFDLEFKDEGLTSVGSLAQSVTKKAIVTLPEGVTINPSVGEGLGICTPAQLERETLNSEPGEGCPNASKLGSVTVQSPLVDEPVQGSVYLAQQDDPNTTTPEAENPFDTLIAFYIVLQNRNLGISIKLPARVEPDPQTGQLITTVEDAPQLPFNSFSLHFSEGARAALVTPPACGNYETEAELTPWARPTQPITVTSSFKVTTGIAAGPCPPGGIAPFKPDYQAGALNNNAGSHTPFYMRLIRSDGEQNMTKFSSVLPPGVLGSLKGIDKCSDQAVEAAKAKSAREEIASPSCPANSQIGRSLAGAGVGAALTYVPGQIYLGGPYKGKPLSVISVTPALAGPFDAGTVVVRLALDLNSETAEVEVDGAASDPIPHILNGIVLKVRDIRVYVDRPNFTFNSTSCDPSSVKAKLFGSYLNIFSPLDDVPVDLQSRYQAANCLNLGYKPSLKLDLRGGTKRGDHPGLKAVFKPRPGDANTAAARVTLPRSAFLEQGHIRTICTRVQFAADQCPAGSIYGWAKAITPLLDEPIEGPVILRSSTNKLPDLVLALKGLVDVNVSSRIDSFKGGIRNTFEVVPDAPVTEFILTLQGGRKGLIVNSKDLCKGRTSRVEARFSAHNGMVRTLRPKLQPRCGGKGKRDRSSGAR